TLRGAGLEETTIAAVPRYASVIKFTGCQNLTIANLTAGHTTEPGFCAGGVLKLENSTDVNIDTCGLYGCGTIGIQAQSCSRLNVTNSSIYECSSGAVDVHQCQDVFISACDVHHHGTREGQGEAMNVFSVSYGEGFTVYNCRIHDNRAQYLLNSSFTKNALFLSNEVLHNAFGAKVFTFQQYGATVDGCRFEGNDVSRGWYTSNGIYAADIEGNALEGAELAEMTLRDIPPESVAPKPASLAQATEVPVGAEVLVKTVDEFLSVIGPDRTIILDGELFDLSTASNYGGIGTDYYYWQENPDGPGLVIHDASGLSIRANNTASGATTIAAIPRYADVLSFRNCDNLFLGGFTAGHTKEPGVCSGGVLNFQNCNQVMIEKMRLYGCGILGIQASYCSSLSVLRTEIYECSQGAGSFFQTDGIVFTECSVHDVPSPSLFFTECGDKVWNNEFISGLDGMYYVDRNGTLIGSEYPGMKEYVLLPPQSPDAA
ncbi:MAG: right-handed parallel beta-helix repeat-containing protein, partial [Oscillospiraceae bacterium]|nr:right-handed parallel beta-helix repeat-containing protein [Oscillospiraceae bacterium]